jgi:Na+-translocating ferredoxin:NAD+ oxidoreductase subunit E
MPPKAPDAYEEFIKGLWRENPVLVQVLGMCPTLAITNSAINALVMGVSTLFVLIAANFFASAFRRWIPHQVRISTYVVIIATFVTAVDLSLNAFLPTIHKALGAFIPLIVVNCIVLARQEAFASRHSVGLALLDAVGMGLGFTLALSLMGSIREILGSGSWLGIPLFGQHFEPWVIMVLPPGGFLTLGFMLLFFRWVKLRRDRLVQQLDAMEA